jgi:hypothetical protein
MKTLADGFALFTSLASTGMGQTEEPWTCYKTDRKKLCIGNMTLRRVDQSGSSTKSLWSAGPVEINIASDANYFLAFEFYEKGVTDVFRENGIQDWQLIDAKAVMYDFDNDEVIKSLPIPITKKEGNNDFYEIKINSLAPSVITEIPEVLKDGGTMRAMLRIVIDGETVATRPVYFKYMPRN